jgi:hypothetical protein
MAVSKDPIGKAVALFGVQAQWPRWKQVQFDSAFERAFTDSTYTGLDASPQFGGNYGETFGEVQTMDRWTDLGDALNQTNALGHALGFSLRWGGGGLYTHGGVATHPDEVQDVGLIHSVEVSCQWYADPAMTTGDTPRIPGLNLERQRSDGQGMLMLGSVASLWFGWAPGGGTTGDSEHTEVATITTMTPIAFDLKDITTSPFTFSATKSVLTTYHPSAPDSTGYHPIRGTTLYEATATLTVEFLA